MCVDHLAVRFELIEERDRHAHHEPHRVVDGGHDGPGWGDDPANYYALDAWLMCFDEDRSSDVINNYACADALADGVLADATDAARELGLAFPVTLTSGAREALGCGYCTGAMDGWLFG